MRFFTWSEVGVVIFLCAIGKRRLAVYYMTTITRAYKDWLKELKQHIHSSQIKAALKVNAELLTLYWHLGKEILDKQKNAGWGDKLIEQLSKDLLHEFPYMKGFSRTNLYYITQWVSFYNSENQIVPQLVGQFRELSQGRSNQAKTDDGSVMLQLVTKIPWGHNREIISKCSDINEALFYLVETIKNNWSRNVLLNQIDSNLWQRKGKAITNFEQTLPDAQSDLARELLKDPYAFDFLNLSDDHKERELETALIDNLTRFLLELGAGFSFVGRQYPIKVGDEDFAIDLLFYHLKLRCFVVIELKAGKFKPEYTGKLNFYLNVVDDILKHQADNPSVGILICRQHNQVVTEYAIRGINRPMGITEYQYTAKLPENLKDSFPTIEQIEERLSEQ
jgi:predicted nuclease of restriction endonuclease-like (RecB) superfamily